MSERDGDADGTPATPGWTDRGPVPTPFELSAGHSRVAHEAFGWCAACKGHTLVDELVAWRNRAGGHGGY